MRPGICTRGGYFGARNYCAFDWSNDRIGDYCAFDWSNYRIGDYCAFNWSNYRIGDYCAGSFRRQVHLQ